MGFNSSRSRFLTSVRDSESSNMGQGSSRIKRSTEVREFRKNFTWSVRNWKALCGSSRTELISPEFKKIIVRDDCWKKKYRFMIWCETILNEDGKCQGLDFRMNRTIMNRDRYPTEPVGYFIMSIEGVQLKCFKKESKDLPKNSNKKELPEVDERW